MPVIDDKHIWKIISSKDKKTDVLRPVYLKAYPREVQLAFVDTCVRCLREFRGYLGGTDYVFRGYYDIASEYVVYRSGLGGKPAGISKVRKELGEQRSKAQRSSAFRSASANPRTEEVAFRLLRAALYHDVYDAASRCAHAMYDFHCQIGSPERGRDAIPDALFRHVLSVWWIYRKDITRLLVHGPQGSHVPDMSMDIHVYTTNFKQGASH